LSAQQFVGATEYYLETLLKQRLTGAVLLVALIVIVVPELLSGPPSHAPAAPVGAADATPADSSAVAVSPIQGAALRTYTIDLEKGRAEPEGVSANQAPTEQASETISQPATAPATTVVTAPAQVRAASDERAAATSTLVTSGYSVQLGSFGNRDNAARLVGAVRAQGFAAYMDQSTGDRRLYRVRVGPVADRAAAERLAAQLAKAGRKGVVVPNS